MIKSTASITQAKNAINNLFEKEVLVTVNLGRNKTVGFTGRLKGVYNALFTVEPNDTNFIGKTTYSYSEYLCGKVKLEEKKDSV